MDIEATFPARYWINLGRRQDRRVETEIALEEAGISAERFPAVDARFVRRERGYASAGRYALALSQRLVLRRAMLDKADAVMVFEDDVVFHPRLRERLEAIELPEDWGIFYLGCAHQERPEPAGPGLVRTSYALDTHAFAVRAPHYRRVMAALSVRTGQPVKHARASDWFLADLHREIPTYACYPNLAWQAPVRSDLAGGTYSNYTPTGEQIAGAGETIGIQGELWGAKRWQGWRREELGDGEDAGEADRRGPALPIAPVRREPRLGILFLTRGDTNQPGIWSEFREQAGDGVRVFAHPKNRLAAERGFLAGSVIAERHETAWGDISLVRAMLALLKAGLEDETLTHFAFVSESCIPTRPWHEMARRLRLDPRSRIDFLTSEEMKPKHLQRIGGVTDLPDRCRRLHSQWCVLDREAATCVTEVDLTSRFEPITASDEHYIGSVLALRGYDDRRIRREATTWVRWNEGDEALPHPQSYSRTDHELAAELASFPGFFARKFPEDADVGKWNLHHDGL